MEKCLDGYDLVWQDDFDYEGMPDPKKWNYDIGDKWFNNELQAYTDRPGNVFVRDGRLIMQALPERHGDRRYTSARLNTYERQSWQYGYFEIRAKLPSGRGSWPALWFLPEDRRRGVSWPLCGEIDMMEYAHMHPGDLVYSLHSQKHNHARKDCVQYSTTVHRDGVWEDFHVFGMEWTPEYIEYYLDGECVCRYAKEDDKEDRTELAWPFDKPYFLIMNIAVGGMMGGPVSDEDLPFVMEVDYVRVYQKRT